jgi:hypothetical protein
VKELVEPVDLCLADGGLNPAAVGWSRRPVHRCNLGRGGKRWDFWGVTDGKLFLEALVARVELGAMGHVALTDLETGARSDRPAPFARAVSLGDKAGAASSCRWLGVELALASDRLVGRARDLEFDLALSVDQDSLSTVVPRPDRFWYTSKHVGVRARGRIAGRDFDGWATLDYGRGRWPTRGTRWNWAVGAAPGIAFNLGARWTDGTGATENGLIVDGKLTKIHTPVRFGEDFSIEGDEVSLRFTPKLERRIGFPPFAGLKWRAGRFDGQVLNHRIDGLIGWAEALDLP